MTEITQADRDYELTKTYLSGCIRGSQDERAAIVAWLRSGGCWETIPYRVEEAYHIAANDIEAGKHNK